MRYSNEKLLDAINANSTTNSNPIDARQVLCVSAQGIASAAGTGTLKLQVSNDKYGALPSYPTNWSDVSGASVTVTGAGTFLIPKTEICNEYARLVYTSTTALIQTITTRADVAGNLNNKYFYISTTTVDYYVWMNVNSAGTDPLVPGKTGVQVNLATGATANDVGDAVAAALDALAFTAPNPAANIITCTNDVAGYAAVAVDSSVATGFTFALSSPSGTFTANLDSKSF